MNSVTLCWVTDHEEKQGNEIADELATAGTVFKMNHFAVWPTMPKKATQAQEQTWDNTCSSSCLKGSDLKMLKCLLTGRCQLRYQLHKIRKSNEFICRICEEEKPPSVFYENARKLHPYPAKISLFDPDRITDSLIVLGLMC